MGERRLKKEGGRKGGADPKTKRPQKSDGPRGAKGEIFLGEKTGRGE